MLFVSLYIHTCVLYVACVLFKQRVYLLYLGRRDDVSFLFTWGTAMMGSKGGGAEEV